MIHRFDEELRKRIATHLEAFERRPHEDASLERAAVAVVLVSDPEGQAGFVITRRASTLRSHGGQWAIPGGRVDSGEAPEQTALRELQEEVGISLPAANVLGRLDDYVTRSGYVITPVVVWGDGAGEMKPNPAEVAAVYVVPLHVLDLPQIPQLHEIPESDRPVLSLPIDMLGASIHAPTAAVLFQLREVAVHGRATRVAHYEQPVFAWR